MMEICNTQINTPDIDQYLMVKNEAIKGKEIHMDKITTTIKKDVYILESSFAIHIKAIIKTIAIIKTCDFFIKSPK